MKSDDFEKGKQHAFDSYCKKVLKNEARDRYDENRRRRKYEVSIGELSAVELGMLFTMDKYFKSELVFQIGDMEIIVNDGRIAAALEQLNDRRRSIVLLSYFLELTDREIGETMGMIRATVQYQRKKALQELRKLLVKEDFEDDK